MSKVKILDVIDNYCIIKVPKSIGIAAMKKAQEKKNPHNP